MAKLTTNHDVSIAKYLRRIGFPTSFTARDLRDEGNATLDLLADGVAVDCRDAPAAFRAAERIYRATGRLNSARVCANAARKAYRAFDRVTLAQDVARLRATATVTDYLTDGEIADGMGTV